MRNTKRPESARMRTNEVLKCVAKSAKGRPARQGFVFAFPWKALIVGAQRAFNQAASMSAEVMVVPAMIAKRAPMPLGANSSDQWSFWQWGYPGIMATDTGNWRNENYHTPGDTADTLDYERMAVVVEGLEAVVRDWAGTANAHAVP